MASKKQIHRKSRIPGIVPVARSRNQWNERVIAELRKDPHGLDPIRVWKLKPRISVRVYNKSLPIDTPEQFKRIPHKNKKSYKPTLMSTNMIVLKDLGYIPKKTKLKDKIKKIRKFIGYSSFKEKKLKNAYEKATKILTYEVDKETGKIQGKSLFKISISFANKVASIKRFVKINIKTINAYDEAERNNEGYYGYFQGTT